MRDLNNRPISVGQEVITLVADPTSPYRFFDSYTGYVKSFGNNLVSVECTDGSLFSVPPDNVIVLVREKGKHHG